jgi:hypothetical protein
MPKTVDHRKINQTIFVDLPSFLYMSYRKRAAPAPSVVVAVAAPDEEVVEFKHFKKRTPVVPPPASQPAVVLVVEEEEQVQLFYSLDACKEEALKYHTKNEFEKKCPDAFAVAKRNEWLDEVCAHMKPAEKLLSWVRFHRKLLISLV